MDNEAEKMNNDEVKREWLHLQECYYTVCDGGAVKIDIDGVCIHIPVGGDGGAKVYVVEDGYYNIPSYYSELLFKLSDDAINVEVYWYDCGDKVVKHIECNYVTIHKSGRSVIVNYKN